MFCANLWDVCAELEHKRKFDCQIFTYETLKDLRDFLERIAFADQEPIAWESEHSGVLHRR